MTQILTNLFEQQLLSREAAKAALIDMSKGVYNDAQIASFLTVFLMRPISVDEVLGFQDALLELCIPFDLQGREAIDIVGTGGDGKNTFNISTIAALVVAGAGYTVCKHGNYGVSSTCGSSNVLEALGYSFTKDSNELHRQLDRAGICFLHAPLFHPAMKRVAPVRKQLGMKTFFNLMGPLVNPAQPKFRFLGVYSPDLGRLYQYALQAGGRQFKVVFSQDGYDEISLTGNFRIWSDTGTEFLDAASLGLESVEPASIVGGATVPESAALFLQILENKGTAAQEAVVIANAGMAIHCMQPEKDRAACLEEAAKSLRSGKALETLKKLINH